MGILPDGVEQLGQKFIQPHFARIEWL